MCLETFKLYHSIEVQDCDQAYKQNLENYFTFSASKVNGIITE